MDFVEQVRAADERASVSQTAFSRGPDAFLDYLFEELGKSLERLGFDGEPFARPQRQDGDSGASIGDDAGTGGSGSRGGPRGSSEDVVPGEQTT